LGEQAISTSPYPLRFHCDVPAALLFIEPTQEQIHLSVQCLIGMNTFLLAMGTLADMNF
jgi:hypothetical protein